MRGLYDKYRVFKEPDNDYGMGHPVPIHGPFFLPDEKSDPETIPEVESWVFVLKPDTDYHARVALAAYAESVRDYDRTLAEDLDETLGDIRNQNPLTRKQPT